MANYGSCILPNGVSRYLTPNHLYARRGEHRGIGLTGPLFGYSDTWQLVINTAATIITFLMVFVIQNTQNRDTAPMHIKIDELIRVTLKARNVLLDLDGLDDKRLEAVARGLWTASPQGEIPNENANTGR